MKNKRDTTNRKWDRQARLGAPSRGHLPDFFLKTTLIKRRAEARGTNSQEVTNKETNRRVIIGRRDLTGSNDLI